MADKWYGASCFINVVMCVADIFCWLCDGTKYPVYSKILPVSEFIFWLAGICIFLTYFRYLHSYISEIKPISKIYYVISDVVATIEILILISTPFTKLFYEIGPDNIYHRGRFFFFLVICQGIFYFETIFIIIRYRKVIHARNACILSCFAIIPILFQAIQICNYGIALNTTGVTLSFLIIFTNLTRQLEENLEKKTKAVINVQKQTIISLSNLVENRDTDTGQHVRRTSEYVKLLATKTMEDGYYLDTLNPDYIMLLEKAAPLHDIGKIIVPDAVLKKPGKLTPEEFEQMQLHAKEGGRIVKEVLGISEDKDYVRIASEISISHHEKWNGKGYPYHFAEDAIPLSARIMAISDVFDALVSPRCYKDPMTYEQAFKIIEEEAGQHFDPILAKEFLSARNEIIAINEKYKLLEV